MFAIRYTAARSASCVRFVVLLSLLLALFPWISRPAAGHAAGADVSSLSGRVWWEENGNRAFDRSEPALGRVYMRLTYLADGAELYTATTPEGTFSFDYLIPGDYRLDVITSTVPAGLRLMVGKLPYDVHLDPGQAYKADFGFAGRGLISGLVFQDFNRDGIQDLDENGLAGMRVCLYQDTDMNGVFGEADERLVCTTTQDPDGSFLFADLWPGYYLLVEDDPAEVVSTTSDIHPAHLIVKGISGSSSGYAFGDVFAIFYRWYFPITFCVTEFPTNVLPPV